MQESDGWIFVQDGAAFAALKVVAGGYAWTPAWKPAQDVRGEKPFITLDTEHSPVILIVNQAADYPAGFAAFQAAVKSQPIDYRDGVLRFATITFHGLSQPSEINGQPLDLAPPRGYDSPFVRSEWGSGRIFIRKGNETLLLDFSNPKKPTKTIGTSPTADYPPGMGTTPAIRWGQTSR